MLLLFFSRFSGSARIPSVCLPRSSALHKKAHPLIGDALFALRSPCCHFTNGTIFFCDWLSSRLQMTSPLVTAGLFALVVASTNAFVGSPAVGGATQARHLSPRSVSRATRGERRTDTDASALPLLLAPLLFSLHYLVGTTLP